MDAKAADPDRELRIIFRQHQANLGKIVEAFQEFDGPFNTGHKYARARLYSTTTSPYLDIEYRNDLEQHKVPCWLNLRNDDLFVLRWGDADYVREFLQNVPRDLMRYEAGFYMGPDGFVFGREFVSKDPELSGQLEIDKHWYRFMLWGRLGYDLTLTRDYFEQRLAQRFPETDAAQLYDTWAAASQIVPQVNRFFFRVNDFQFSPEGCIYNGGFLSLDQFFEHPPLVGLRHLVGAGLRQGGARRASRSTASRRWKWPTGWIELAEKSLRGAEKTRIGRRHRQGTGRDADRHPGDGPPGTLLRRQDPRSGPVGRLPRRFVQGRAQTARRSST